MIRALVILLFLGSLSAKAQDTVVLKPVVVRDTRLFTKETAGSKQTQIDSLVLQQNLNHTLSELLSENTTVFIKAYGRGSMATASFRGTAPSHTQVLWNGMSINSPMLGMVDFSLLPAYFIDNVKLKHGGASIEDIGGALGGSIVMENKPDWDNTFGGKVVLGAGSFNTTEAFAQLNIGNKGLQSKTRVYHTYSKNNFPFVNDAIIGAPLQRNNHADYRMYSIMQELYARVNTRSVISLKGWLHHADRSIPALNSFEGSDSANINRQVDRSYRFNAAWDHHYTHGTLTAMAALNIQYLDYTLKNFVSGQGFQSGIYSTSKAVSSINKIQLAHDFNPHSSFHINFNANHHSVNTADSIKKTGYERTRNELLFYAGYHHTFKDRLNIRLSARQDYIDGKFIPLIPSVGFDLRLHRDHNLFLKGNIIRNYHVPTLNDLYWQPGGNPLLQPERGLSEEATLVWQRNYPKINLETQLTGFYADITDWIVWIPNFKGYWEPHNVKKVISKGIEAGIKATALWGQTKITFNGNYALTRSLNYGDTKTWGDESYGKQLVYIPVHSGNVFINVSYKTYSITWQHNAYSRRYTTSSNDLTFRDNLPNYFMNQLYVSKTFKWKMFVMEPQLKVYNLFDEYYRSVLSRRMPGRNYMVLLMIRF